MVGVREQLRSSLFGIGSHSLLGVMSRLPQVVMTAHTSIEVCNGWM